MKIKQLIKSIIPIRIISSKDLYHLQSRANHWQNAAKREEERCSCAIQAYVELIDQYGKLRKRHSNFVENRRTFNKEIKINLKEQGFDHFI